MPSTASLSLTSAACISTLPPCWSAASPRRLQLLQTFGDKEQVGTFARIFFGNGAPDAPAGPGDQRPASFKSLAHRILPDVSPEFRPESVRFHPIGVAWLQSAAGRMDRAASSTPISPVARRCNGSLLYYRTGPRETRLTETRKPDISTRTCRVSRKRFKTRRSVGCQLQIAVGRRVA